MTLEEKAAQLTGVWYADLLVEGQLDDERMTQHLSHGIGQITRIDGLIGYVKHRLMGRFPVVSL